MKGKYKKIKIKENHKKVKLKHEKFFNYGLALLKSYMAFLVLISHCFNRKTFFKQFTKKYINFYVFYFIKKFIIY